MFCESRARWHRRLLLLLVGAAAISAARSAELTVEVLDPQGQGTVDVVIVVTPETLPPHSTASATIDQVRKAFVPQISVIRVGTAVTFPNSDPVAHQVYSFSPAKRFDLPLYRGRPYAPIVFDQPGIVILGCNIHDQMIGYIYVTESPYFGRTDARGRLILRNLPAERVRVTAWNPYLSEQPPEQTADLRSDGRLSFRLTRSPRAPRKAIDPRLREY